MTESVERLPGEQVEAPDARSATPLIDEANDLAEALDRLRGGEHGTCEECRSPITPARLRATPDATTCLRCQGRLEQSARRLQTMLLDVM